MHARKRATKHGGGCHRVDLEEALPFAEEPAEELLSLNEALDQLAQEDSKKAELVELRYFTGLSVQQAADVLGISRAIADRYWACAKVSLYCAISGESERTLQWVHGRITVVMSTEVKSVA
jgi:DNA-directed RNA polymerase specialized sigma24 family protein